jgi:NADPH-dependent 7-cyano-7-deazaguanine reductase QueF-like protein
MSTSPEHSPLGRPSAYVDTYDASLLYPIPRGPKRAELGIRGPLPFYGVDLWTAYELSWLNPRGKPEVAILRFTVSRGRADSVRPQRGVLAGGPGEGAGRREPRRSGCLGL